MLKTSLVWTELVVLIHGTRILWWGWVSSGELLRLLTEHWSAILSWQSLATNRGEKCFRRGLTCSIVVYIHVPTMAMDGCLKVSEVIWSVDAQEKLIARFVTLIRNFSVGFVSVTCGCSHVFWVDRWLVWHFQDNNFFIACESRALIGVWCL